MSIWVWLSRVTLLSLVGTAALAALLFSTPSKNSSDRAKATDEPNRLQAAAITPEEITVLNLSAPMPPPPMPQSDFPMEAGDGKKVSIKSGDGEKPATKPGEDKKAVTKPEKDKQTSTKPGEDKKAVTKPEKDKQTSTKPTKGKTASAQPKGTQKIPAPPFNLQKSLMSLSPLFASPTSLGMVAIGVAEGNYRLVVKNGVLYVQQTPLYFGHTDPGNLSWGAVVTNFGPCSDQGRSGGNMALAEQMCLERALNALPVQLVDLNAAGINPIGDIEALLNTADLYNQASPIHSRFFPRALAIARRGGLQGIEAIAWARTASFYLNSNNELDIEKGINQASGLLGICARENRPVTEWQCVYGDQMRRVKEITNVLDKYRRLARK
ncbi:hypothetical protein [Allocoleopsis franciscana]|uniref:Uncharacterized protein n=1 Tax=Allocoleopsis franciscana PCC 7113 TaxID=1173027 RepID=K9WP22_9CYAN|nr:hypothetical protein [Allocoleopsis franciscana]AFZ21292.1 hypothetical protein Mic7113_5665 [Allocoleopsis franciscana PCC 7113]